MSGRDSDYDGSIATIGVRSEADDKKKSVPAQQFRTTGILLRSSVLHRKAID
jgi:hypothetical protein